MIELRLFGKPVAWAASRVGKKGHFNPRSEEKKAFMWQIKAAYKGPMLAEGYFHLNFWFEEPIPASTSKEVREEMLRGNIIPSQNDCTNMQKFYEDCLKGIVIDDDRYVSHVSSSKKYSDEPGIYISITQVGKRPLDKKTAAKHKKENLGGFMSLIKSKSKKALGKNIKAELEAGKPLAQARAIGLNVARKAGVKIPSAAHRKKR